MIGVPRRTRSTGAIALLLLLVLVLTAAVANFVIALTAMNAPPIVPIGRTNVFGAEASAAGWSAATPPPWPAPTQVSADWSRTHRVTMHWSSIDGATTHGMQHNESGWPWPVLERVQLWWPWDDPAWATTVPPDSGVRLVPLGAIVPPIVAGTLLWLVFVAPFVAVPALRRRRRAARGQCIDCGYPLGGADTCPECGMRAA